MAEAQVQFQATLEGTIAEVKSEARSRFENAVAKLDHTYSEEHAAFENNLREPYSVKLQNFENAAKR